MANSFFGTSSVKMGRRNKTPISISDMELKNLVFREKVMIERGMQRK